MARLINLDDAISLIDARIFANEQIYIRLKGSKLAGNRIEELKVIKNAITQMEAFERDDLSDRPQRIQRYGE